MSLSHCLRALIAFAVVAGLSSARPVQAAVSNEEAKAKQVWQMFNYVAIDYGGAVSNGAVIKASEYTEMQEFAAAERHLGELTRRDATAELQTRAAALRRAITNKADPTAVAQLAHSLAKRRAEGLPLRHRAHRRPGSASWRPAVPIPMRHLPRPAGSWRRPTCRQPGSVANRAVGALTSTRALVVRAAPDH